MMTELLKRNVDIPGVIVGENDKRAGGKRGRGVYLLLSFIHLSHHRTFLSAHNDSLHLVQPDIIVR